MLLTGFLFRLRLSFGVGGFSKVVLSKSALMIYLTPTTETIEIVRKRIIKIGPKI